MKSYTFKFRNPTKNSTVERKVEIKTTKELLTLCNKAYNWTIETKEGRYVTVTNEEKKRLAVDELIDLLRKNLSTPTTTTARPKEAPKETLVSVLEQLPIAELVKLCLRTGLHIFNEKTINKIRYTCIRNNWWGGQQEMIEGAKKVREMNGVELAKIYPDCSKVGSRSEIMCSVSHHIYGNKEDKVIARLIERLEATK